MNTDSMIKVTLTDKDGIVLDQFKLDMTDREKARAELDLTPAHVANNVRNMLSHVYEVED